MPKTKTTHERCPNCECEWDDNEVRKQRCDLCGYPDVVTESFDDDDDDETGYDEEL